MLIRLEQIVATKSVEGVRRINAWFASTGKKLPNLKKLGRGLYGLVE